MGVDRAIDITAAQRKIILALLRKHLPNTTAWVYGSRATWNARPQSDLDMVVFTAPAQERGVSDLRDAFEESALPFRVDLFVWDTVPESFHKQIEAEHVVLVEKEERGGAGEWSQATLGSIALNEGYGLVDGPFGSNLPASLYTDEGIPVIRGSNLALGTSRFRAQEFVFVSSDTAKRLARSLCRPLDIIFTKKGTLGQTGLVPEDGEYDQYLLSSNQMKLTVDPLVADPLFVYYFVSSPESTEKIIRDSEATGVPKTNVAYLREFPITLPPLPEQRAIAHILGTLDDKIELNRRMNETLEEMARTLFKSWFVDFDPVHAKATLKRHAANQSSRQGDSAQATEAARSGITPPLRGSRQAKGVSPQARRRGEIRRLYSPQTLQKAQALRQTQTDAEGLLWHYLRNKQLGGYKFRRQQPIGPYIADFACLSQKLLIELDGSQHATRQDYDEKRDAFLRERGYRVLRFWNNQVFENCFGVLERIYAVLPHHPPLDGGSKDASLSGRGVPPPQQPAPDGLAAATPPQGGSDWTVERAQAYLDGMDADIAALFPDSFVDSELGPIPAGWEISTIGREVDVVGGSTPSTKKPEFWDGGVYWATPKDLSTLSSPVLLKTERTITEAGLAKISSGLLPTGTVLLSSRAPIGYLAIAEIPVSINQGFIAMKCMRRISSVHAWLWSKNNMDAILQNANGSTFQEISKRNFRPLPMIVAGDRLLAAFNETAKPLYGRIAENERESRALTALRDTLLPKLVSGELRLRDREGG